MPTLTWTQFESTAKNIKEDFENLCRVFFKQHICKDEKDVVLSLGRPNNPGVEIEPVLVGGRRVSFQSKHFSNSISYEDILESARMSVKHYSGKIDTIYFFCNKDVTKTSKNYVEAKRILENNNIELINFSNRTILETIEQEDYLSGLAVLYFNQISFDKKWFDNNLKLSLEDLAPRYTKGFNVKTEFEDYFETLYLSDEFLDILNKRVLELKDEVKRISYSIKDEIVHSIINKIESLSIPSRESIKSIFSWIDQFKEDIEKIESTIDNLDVLNPKLSKDDIEITRNKKYMYSELLELLGQIDLKSDPLFSVINSNILIVEGRAGTGKSHLIGYMADKYMNIARDRTILLLGQKLIGDNHPEEQIKSQLGLTCSFDDFLNAIEAKGDLDGSVTVIILDAINECSNNRVWKNYLNELVNKILNYKYVRLLISIRETYKDSIFTAAINKKIKDKLISIVEHAGFLGNIHEAIPAFFKYHGIPITTTAYLGYEFANPLFLKLFCETHSKGDLIGSKGIIQLFKTLAKREEENIKDKLETDDTHSYVTDILNITGKYFFENKTYSLSRSELLKITSHISKCGEYIDKMLKGKIFTSYRYDSEEWVYLAYEKFSDYLIAEHIMKQSNSLSELRSYIKDNLLMVGKKYFTYPRAIGIFSALTVMVSEQYDSEILDIIDELDVYDHVKQQIVKDYIEQYPFRANQNMKAKSYFSAIEGWLNNSRVIEANFDMLITMSGRPDSELNANALTMFLKKYTLPGRDYLWTTYINEKYTEGERIYNTIKYFLDIKRFELRGDEKILYAQELSWFLSSSNRSLRDDSTRALVNILIDDIKVMHSLLVLFIDVNDPYIIQRVFGAIYGAILRSNITILNKTLFSNLVKYIYENIFSKDEVYPDILLRDYALNIIEYAAHLGIEMSFNIDVCRPPYKSIKIPMVDKKLIKTNYDNDNQDKTYPGTTKIQWSMAPDCNNSGYGDFGRYVFQSAMNNFKDIDIDNLYYYALDYIKNTLGYKNEWFNIHDRYLRVEGWAPSIIERIGKKYQWIAMYHILAKVSDHHEYFEKFSDEKVDKYKGSWRPYVRDFDPTVELVDSERTYELDFSFEQKRFNEWDLQNPDWITLEATDYNLDSIIKLKDSNDEEWISLNCYITDKSTSGYERDYQGVSTGIKAYIIKKNQFEYFVKNVTDRTLYTGLFPERNAIYNVFLKEYFWSPAYFDETLDQFKPVEVDLGKREKIKTMMPKFLGRQNDISKVIVDDIPNEEEMISENLEDDLFKIEECEYESTIYESIGDVLPCYHEYSWSEEYDFSKKEAISINIPNAMIVNELKLEQVKNGIFTYESEIACADFSLVKCNANGLYIKKKLINKFLRNEYELIFVCTEWKDDIKKDGNGRWERKDSLIHYSGDGEMKLVGKFKDD